VLWPAVTVATQHIQPGFLPSLASRPLAWLLAGMALGGVAAVFAGQRRGRDLAAFLGSCAFLAGLSTATAACVFPTMLRAIGADAPSLTIYSAGGDPRGLRTALGWFMVGFPLVVAYFFIVFRLHRGKTAVPSGAGY